MPKILINLIHQNCQNHQNHKIYQNHQIHSQLKQVHLILQLRLFDYSITNLTSRGSTWDGTCDDDLDKEELMTKIFGFPDEETLLQLLQNEPQQPVVKTSDMCPNCESPSMSRTHICENDND